MSQPNLSTESANGIKKLSDTTQECMHSLRSLEVDVDTWDPIVIYILVQKLDQESERLWEQSQDPKVISSLDELLNFLEKRYHTLEILGPLRPKIHENSRTTESSNKPRTSNHHSNVETSNTSRQNCAACNKSSHPIFKCRIFLQMKIAARKALITSISACTNCLSSAHQLSSCSHTIRCKKCNAKHHTLLHSSNTNEEVLSSPNPTDQLTAVCAHSESSTVLLATALINIPSKTGEIHTFRALIDQGSQATFMTTEAAQKLKLPTRRAATTISGIGTSKAGSVKRVVTIQLRSTSQSNFSVIVNALLFKSLTKFLPSETVKRTNWSHINGLSLADPTFHNPGKIDVLLGADVYTQIILNGLKKGRPGSPIAQNTELGWILSGSCSAMSSNTPTVHNFNLLIDIDKNLKRFWEIEETPHTKYLTEEENQCEEIFINNHRRNYDGRYIVKLPMRSNIGQLGKSRPQAVARLLQMERKFKINKDLHQEYVKFMNDYINLGHMEKISKEVLTNTSCYLPHHAVFKKGSTSTKLRVVFDASAKTTNGLSLNDKMFTGPTLQNEIFSTILRWRKFRYAFTADIQKMYRQILVTNEDKDFQRIVWRSSPSEPIKDFRLCTVTYGTSSAPYLAIRSLLQLAVDVKSTFPLAAASIEKDFYVDDAMAGEDTYEEAVELQRQLIAALHSSGMELRKWASNSPILLKSIPEEHREKKSTLEINPDQTIKTLGIHWNTDQDHFQFRVNIDAAANPVTKRSLLSEASKLFDPLGWLAPSIIPAKIMFQQLWLQGLNWDDPLPPNIATKWEKYHRELPKLQEIRIARWTGECKTSSIEIHGFSDASTLAFAAVVYSRTIDTSGRINITLIAAKTRVAPVKQISIPRLELCGAVLLKRLLSKIKDDLDYNDVPIFAWTDSTIVLGWLRGHPSKWKTFVANRVAEIHNKMNVNQWHHVSSEQNPADCASRGITPADLKEQELWWQGPSWLKKTPDHWPPDHRNEAITLEQKSTTVVLTATQPIEFITIADKFSSFNRLIRTTVYCFRFAHNTRTRINKRTGAISVDEFQYATTAWIKLVQLVAFPNEISLLKRNKLCPSKSNILPLYPFLDNELQIRVNGRIQNSNVTANEKQPIILPYNSHFTKLVIQQAHESVLHSGIQATLNHLRQTYWLLKGRRAVKEVLHRCVKCHRFKSLTNNQLMGNLPCTRITPSAPFTNTGVDYAGPFDIRVSKGRGTKSYKGYISLFICLSTKAIHLEIVSDLTTESFIAALKRFMARRGLCSNIYSDNGTTFVGASSHLSKDAIQATKANSIIKELLSNDKIQWHFIPPLTPHFGGLWEAGVKSTKYHLKRILGNHLLTYEEFSTVLTQIEGCLNSRPLCPLTNDIEDLDTLTPGHFLIGRPIMAPPTNDITDVNLNRLKRWELVQRMHQDFWKIWSKEYLSRLQQRPKWTKIKEDFKTGDLVLIKDEQTPPSKWPLGRIMATHPGPDHLIRVVTVKTRSSTFKRNITKLSRLPITDNYISDQQ